MDKKIMTLLIILIFAVGCVSFVWADKNTTDNLTVENIEENMTDNNLSEYIIPVHITDNGIEFSDGFIGFCIDSSKDVITVNDKFTSQNTRNDEIENNVKLAIIECYKAGKENDIQNVVSQILNGNKNYDIVDSVLNSGESVNDAAVVKINNTTEATFTFELLKPTDDSKSDCLAYTVSLKTVDSNDEVNDAAENTTENNSTIENTTENNSTTEDTNISDAQVTTNQTIVNNTNNTILNNTNNNITNENNTTIINQNNTKIINKTNETPKNATIQETIMRVVGNPITILVIVIAILAVVGVVMKRKQ